VGGVSGQPAADRCLLGRVRVTFGAAVVDGLLRGMRESAADLAALGRYRAALAALYVARGGSPEEAAALASEVQRIALWGVS
jgi:hypothetical protein